MSTSPLSGIQPGVYVFQPVLKEKSKPSKRLPTNIADGPSYLASTDDPKKIDLFAQAYSGIEKLTKTVQRSTGGRKIELENDEKGTHRIYLVTGEPCLKELEKLKQRAASWLRTQLEKTEAAEKFKAITDEFSPNPERLRGMAKSRLKATDQNDPTRTNVETALETNDINALRVAMRERPLLLADTTLSPSHTFDALKNLRVKPNDNKIVDAFSTRFGVPLRQARVLYESLSKGVEEVSAPQAEREFIKKQRGKLGRIRFPIRNIDKDMSNAPKQVRIIPPKAKS